MHTPRQIQWELPAAVAAEHIKMSIVVNSKYLRICSKAITQNTLDGLRIALGNYYAFVSDDGMSESFEFREGFDNPSDVSAPDRPFDMDSDHSDLREEKVQRGFVSTTHKSLIEKIEVNSAMITPINKNAYIPNFKIPVRLYASRDSVTGDQYWKTFLMGGTYGGTIYPQLFNNEDIFYDIEMGLAAPYSEMEIKDIPLASYSAGLPMQWKIQSHFNDYDEYVEKYINWSKTKHELLLPNFNYAGSMPLSKPGDLSWDSSTPAGKQRKLLNEYYYPYGVIPDTFEKNAWCGNEWIQIEQDKDLEAEVKNAQQNIIFDDYFFDEIADSWSGGSSSGGMYVPFTDVYESLWSTMLGSKIDHSSNMYNISCQWRAIRPMGDLMPDDTYEPPTYTFDSYVKQVPKLTVEEYTPGGIVQQDFVIRNVISDNDFSSKFLESLKDLHEGEIQSVPVTETEYDINSEYYEGSIKKSTIESKRFKTFDWMQFLLYNYNEYDGAINDNYSFVGKPKASHDTTYDDSTLYRFFDNQNVLKTIHGTIENLTEYMASVTEAVDSDSREMDASFEGAGTGAFKLDRNILSYILSPIERRSEVLAYRIEKYGGEPAGDSSTQDLIQNFWIFNSKNLPVEMELIDTQVKYGEPYTYRVYAYTLVLSYKYRYTDFRLTKQIGVEQGTAAIEDDPETEDVDETVAAVATKYCLQFYDPFTDELANQIFSVVSSEDEREISAVAGFNTFATNGIDISEHPQLADFNFNVEPCYKVIEVPLFEKTTAVYDNPPNNISVVPFHFVDDSNRVGFDIFPDGFSTATTYPIPITDNDILTRTRYLNDKDSTVTEYLPKFSESPARYIEIFRSSNKPTSFEDFDGKLVSRIDLRIPSEEYNRKGFIATDKIDVNKKYYYVFRFVNENDMPGPLSAVIEVELHNDGGYVYSLFDILDSSEFKKDPFTVNSVQFKKIFQLEPNIQQMILDTENANFGNKASDEIDNVEVGMSGLEKIWDKKFKIRLTSKKTGKKLDINVTYNLRDRDLSPSYDIPESFSPTAPGTEDEEDTGVIDGVTDAELAAAAAAAGDDSDEDSKIICSELFRQGLMETCIYEADEEFGRLMIKTDPDVVSGYQLWARPVVEIMRESALFTQFVYIITKPWTIEMAHQMGALDKGSLVGKVMMAVGLPFSKLINRIFSKKNERVNNGIH
jgi:hypothetical protein